MHRTKSVGIRCQLKVSHMSTFRGLAVLEGFTASSNLINQPLPLRLMVSRLVLLHPVAQDAQAPSPTPRPVVMAHLMVTRLCAPLPALLSWLT